MSEQNEIEPLAFGDYLAVLKRRKWRFLVPFLIVLSASVALSIFLPPTYRSNATLMVERQEIPVDMVGTTVTGFVQERIESVSKRVSVQDNLLKIASDVGLYDDTVIESDPGLVVEEMRNAALVEMVDIQASEPGRGRQSVVTVAFTIAYDHEDPAKAKQVVDAVSQLFIDENRRLRLEQASKVSKFLDAEGQKLVDAIKQYEAQLADFKAENDGRLPGQIEVGKNALERLEAQVQAADESIRALTNQRRTLSGELRVTPKYQAWGLEDENAVPQSESQKLAAAKQELKQLQQKYSDIHPDIIRLKSAIDSLQKSVASSGTSSVDRVAGDATNPVFIKLKAQLQGIEADLAAENKIRVELEERMEKYALAMMDAPAVEKEYNNIQRNLATQYESLRMLKDKQQQASLATTLEEGDKGQKFTLLEPANVPRLPESPNRLGIALLGMFLGFMMGLVSVLLAEMSDKTIRSAKQLQAVFKSPPIAAIPFYDGIESR